MKIMYSHRTGKFLIACILLLLSCATFAQTIKTGVLVVGASSSGLSAAIQSAHSGAKTVLVDKGNFESVSIAPFEAGLRSGVYAGFIKRVETAQRYPVTPNQVFSPAFTATMFKAWTDTVKNLTVINKATVVSVRKNGKSWEAVLSDKKEIRADVLVDASPDRYITKLAGDGKPASAPKADSIPYTSKKYRTGVAIVQGTGYVPATLPVSALLTDTENFIATGNELITPTMSTGQAAGAIGAFCSFFKTTTKNLNVRTIQSELVSFGSQLISFDDIGKKDSNVVAVQNIALAGILKGKLAGGKFLFLPDSTVSTREIREPVREYYFRSQIWFPDNDKQQMTIKDVLSLIKFVAARGEELNREVEKAWVKGLKLPGKFDLNRPATRREFAVLFNTYVKPFIVAVDLNGQVKR